MKNLKLHHDDALNMVIVEVEGMVTGENVRKTIFAAFDFDKAYNCKTFLVDISKCRVDTLYIEAFMNMHKMAEKFNILPGNKFAVIFDPANYPEERARFIEAITKDVANPPLKMFLNRADAIEWLSKIRP